MANSVYMGQMPQTAASNLCVHWSLKSTLWDIRSEWVMYCYFLCGSLSDNNHNIEVLKQ